MRMNPTYLQQFLSDTARKGKRSEIRELLKLTARPEVISLAGGLPSPKTFPLEEMAELVPGMLRTYGANALQYGPTEGDIGLREELIKMMAEDGLPGLTLDEIIVTSASQQGLDITGRVFLAPGDTVVCGLPSYLGALGAFAASGARMTGIVEDDEGMPPDKLEERLIMLRRQGIRPKILYLVPDFQNPSGVTLSLERRRDLMSIASEFDLLILEDSPYRQLRYVGEHLPNMKSLDREGRVISLFTFSKILFPGLRLGWLVADREVVSRYVVAKQSVDLCTSALTQLLAREYLKTGRLPAQIERTKRLYTEKRKIFLEALDRVIDPSWGVRWTRPEGGLFLWMTLPGGMSARALLDQALQENVAFVCGSAFHCDGSGENTLRLNFSYPSNEQLLTGAERIARAIERMVETRAASEVAFRAVDPAALPVSAGAHSLEQLAWNLGLSEVVE
jgi:2-aminoadipate transaminase